MESSLCLEKYALEKGEVDKLKAEVKMLQEMLEKER